MKKLLNSMYKPKVFAILLVGFMCATVVVSVQASTLGTQMGDYQDTEIRLSREVEELENELVTLASLSTKIEESEKLGLDEPTEIYYLKPQETFASR